MGTVRVMTSSHQICLLRAHCGEPRNKAIADRLFSTQSCKAQERSQRKLHILRENDLSRHDWHSTRFGGKLLAQILANCLQDPLLGIISYPKPCGEFGFLNSGVCWEHLHHI